MNYSICLLDNGGRTEQTQFGPYEDDAAALVQARKDVASSPIVEVWKKASSSWRGFFAIRSLARRTHERARTQVDPAEDLRWAAQTSASATHTRLL
jgi:hypothetical protein